MDTGTQDFRPKLINRLTSKRELLDPYWVEAIVADTHDLIQEIRRKKGLPEWKFEDQKKRTDDERAAHQQLLNRSVYWLTSQKAKELAHKDHRGITIPAALVSSVVKKHRDNGYSMFGAARQIGINDALLAKIENGTKTRAYKQTLRKLYAWLGEPIPPELEKAP